MQNVLIPKERTVLIQNKIRCFNKHANNLERLKILFDCLLGTVITVKKAFSVV